MATAITNLKNINKFNIQFIEGTCFDVFGKGALPQAFIGIMGEAGSGKTQTVMRLISDISLLNKYKILVILTEQSPSRYKFLLDKYDHNPDNIDIIYSYYISDSLINDLKETEHKIIVFDSISGGINEQNARKTAHAIRGLSEWKGKWVIGILQVRGDGKTVAGGEGVEHNVDVLYEISNFILKPQNWNYKFFSALGYDVGANIRVMRCRYNKIFGNPSVQALLDFTSNGVDLVKIENV